jgi:cytochrome c oxidase subunit 2
MRPFRKRPFRYLGLVAIVASSQLLAACAATDGPLTTFSNQGYESQQIQNLFWPIFWMAIGVFVVVNGALLWSVIRYRRRPNDGIPVQLHGNTRIELAWTIAPALLVLGIAVMTFRTQALLDRPVENPLEVTVVGHQWWWEFQYPEQNIITANELHLPSNRDVVFTLRSADVIHSFWMPRLAGTTDMIPGHENKLIVRPLETQRTLIRGHCKEFCGGTHAMMAFHVVVEPQADFDNWIRQQQAAAPVPAGVQQAAAASAPAVGATVAATAAGTDGVTEDATGDEISATTAATAEAIANQEPTPTTEGAQPASAAAQGYALFASKGCIGCHAIQGYPGAVSRVGPDLTHIGSRTHIVSGWLENTPDEMRRWLRDPGAIKQGNVMANAVKLGTLKEDEISALTEYLRSLQ